MSRILSIDYGQKRVGIAVTDMMQMIAGPLRTVHVKDIWIFLAEYLNTEEVEKIIVGYPTKMDNEASGAVRFINPFVKKLKKEYPAIEVILVDERFTSQMAIQAMIDGGMKKKDRQNKANVDKISAAIILQSFLEQNSNR